MKQRKWFVVLFAAFLLSVMAFSVPVWADENSSTCNPDAAECDCTGDECPDIPEGVGGIYIYADGTSESKTLESNIESEETAAELIALNNGSITLNAADDEGSSEIYGTETGLSINTKSGGKVTANTAGIGSEGTGIDVNAEAGTTVNITNEDYLDGYDAFYAVNNGGDVTLDTADIWGVVGVGIYSGAGTTTVTTNSITVEEYGVAVDVYKDDTADAAPKVTVTVNGDITDDVAGNEIPDVEYDEPEPEDPENPDDPEDETVLKAADVDADDPYSEEWWNDVPEEEYEPETNEGDEEVGDDIPDGSEAPDPGEDIWDIDWDETTDGENSSESVNSTGVVISADGEGSKVDVTVSGMISTSYGNEIDAVGGSDAAVTVSGDVETDYGNRISAEGSGTKAAFNFGGNINAGGIALDTFSNSGQLTVDVTGDILAENTEEGDPETAGIYSDSEDAGTTSINVSKGIKVVSSDKDQTTYGIDTGNIGGKIEITVGKNVEVNSPVAVGISITNDPESILYGEDENEDDENGTAAPKDAEESLPETTVTVNGNVTAAGSGVATGTETWNNKGKTNITIDGDLTGSTYGLSVDAYGVDKNSSFTDILVTGTISGKKASFLVNNEADNDGDDNDNLNLTVWKIDLTGSPIAAQNEYEEKQETVENNINYIIKIDPDSEGKIKVVKADGSSDPDTSHDYPAAKKDEKIYVLSADGSELPGVTNGQTGKTALSRDETGFYLVVPNGGGIWLAVGVPEPEPVTPPNRIDFFTIGDLSWLYDRELPHTGFSAKGVTALAARPQGLAYRSTGLTLQIPGLDVAEEILTVPEVDGSYPVEWLNSAVGMLEGSSLPGKGITVLTGHNHLNTSEAGPFLFLGSLENGDLLMINNLRDQMQMYKVYGNYKIASDGFASLASDLKDNALVLITCEDEALTGGYINRRVILAEPM